MFLRLRNHSLSPQGRHKPNIPRAAPQHHLPKGQLSICPPARSGGRLWGLLFGGCCELTGTGAAVGALGTFHTLGSKASGCKPVPEFC